MHIHPTKVLSASLLLAFAIASFAMAQDNSPRFRGADATGVAENHASLPEQWSKTENVLWKASVPGWGWSCPVVWGNRVFVTAVSSDDDYDAPKKGLYLGRGRSEPPDALHHWNVHCFDLETGSQLWQQQVHEGRPEFSRHPKSTYASETPATDGERLFVLFGDLGLYAFDFHGTLLWKRPIEAKKTFYDYGAAASPIVYDGQVIMIYDNQDDSYIASYDAETGIENWKTARDEKSTWATPYVWRNSERTEIIISGKTAIRSYSPQGQLLWSFDGDMSGLIIPSPFAIDDVLYVTSGYVGDKHRPVYAFAPGAMDEIKSDDESIRWYLPTGGPYNTSPIVYEGRYYTLYDRGFLTCHDAETGAEIYGKQRFPGGATFTSSPWAYNGKIFCLSEDGETFVVEAGDEFNVLHQNDLEDLCLATPATAQGKLLIRTASELYCIVKQ